jgi:hypothetical protein
MMSLVIPDHLELPASVAGYLPSVRLELAEHDAMYHGNDHHYLSCGASALNTILAALRLASLPDPRTVLDFGAGAGRVTRWLKAAFPNALIGTCDLRAQDMAFCERAFSAHTWLSTTEIDALHAPRSYDLIWLGSVATHLSADDCHRLIDKVLSWVDPKGLVVMSLHGRFALERQRSGALVYIHDSGWQTIEQGYATDGYGYADYQGQSGYGISITKLSWTARLVESRPDVRLVLLAETAWDGHHDVVAIQSMAPPN